MYKMRIKVVWVLYCLLSNFLPWSFLHEINVLGLTPSCHITNNHWRTVRWSMTSLTFRFIVQLLGWLMEKRYMANGLHYRSHKPISGQLSRSVSECALFGCQFIDKDKGVREDSALKTVHITPMPTVIFLTRYGFHQRLLRLMLICLSVLFGECGKAVP